MLVDVYFTGYILLFQKDVYVASLDEKSFDCVFKSPFFEKKTLLKKTKWNKHTQLNDITKQSEER